MNGSRYPFRDSTKVNLNLSYSTSVDEISYTPKSQTGYHRPADNSTVLFCKEVWGVLVVQLDDDIGEGHRRMLQRVVFSLAQ